jgi:hypothetical protein
MPIWSAIDSYQNFARNHQTGDFNWFERTNRIHLRDLQLIHLLKQVTRDVATHTKRRVVIMSAQMGMVAYHLTVAEYGNIYLLDLDGLISPDFMQCQAIPNLTKESLGTVVSYPVYFQHWNEMSSQCGIPRPDIIYDLRTFDSSLVEQHGYRIVLEQVGSIPADAMLFHGAEVTADEFVAVREDLLPGLHPISPNRLQF